MRIPFERERVTPSRSSFRSGPEAGPRVRVLLFGPAAELGAAGPGIEVIDAPLSIAKEANPAAAARSHPESSIVRAARAVAAGDADALVSGGSTGAALAAALFNIK